MPFIGDGKEVDDLHSLLTIALGVSDQISEGQSTTGAVMLSPWSIDVKKFDPNDDGLAVLLAMSLTPAGAVDQLLEEIKANKGFRMGNWIRPRMTSFTLNTTTTVISFDGSAKSKSRIGSCGFVVWSLPTWTIQCVHANPLADTTMNQSEYRGCIAALEYAIFNRIDPDVITGDSQVIIEQVNGSILCKESALVEMLERVRSLGARIQSVHFVHGIRGHNVDADYVTNQALVTREPVGYLTIVDH